jgi:hypothetical protein
VEFCGLSNYRSDVSECRRDNCQGGYEVRSSQHQFRHVGGAMQQKRMSLPKRLLGSSGVEITVVGFGTWTIDTSGWAFSWGPQDDAAFIATMRHPAFESIPWIRLAGEVSSLTCRQNVPRRQHVCWNGGWGTGLAAAGSRDESSSLRADGLCPIIDEHQAFAWLWADDRQLHQVSLLKIIPTTVRASTWARLFGLRITKGSPCQGSVKDRVLGEALFDLWLLFVPESMRKLKILPIDADEMRSTQPQFEHVRAEVATD